MKKFSIGLEIAIQMGTLIGRSVALERNECFQILEAEMKNIQRCIQLNSTNESVKVVAVDISSSDVDFTTPENFLKVLADKKEFYLGIDRCMINGGYLSSFQKANSFTEIHSNMDAIPNKGIEKVGVIYDFYFVATIIVEAATKEVALATKVFMENDLLAYARSLVKNTKMYMYLLSVKHPVMILDEFNIEFIRYSSQRVSKNNKPEIVSATISGEDISDAIRNFLTEEKENGTHKVIIQSAIVLN